MDARPRNRECRATGGHNLNRMTRNTEVTMTGPGSDGRAFFVPSMQAPKQKNGFIITSVRQSADGEGEGRGRIVNASIH